MKKTYGIVICLALVVVFAMALSACSTGNAASTLAVGDIVQLGGYDWRVLEVKDGKAFVLSENVLFKRQYLQQDNIFKGAPVAWHESDLREYLNGEFYNTTFSAAEQKRIVESTMEIEDNPWYPTEYHPDVPWYSAPGVDTKDKMSLLSIEEVLKYFGDSGEMGSAADGRSFISDQYNEARIAETLDGEICWWWLRSPGLFYSACGANFVNATSITAFGAIGVEGELVANEFGGVRPVMWVKL